MRPPETTKLRRRCGPRGCAPPAGAKRANEVVGIRARGSWAGDRICSCAREQRFVVEAEVVRDKTTGLTWQRRDSSLEGPVVENGNKGRVKWAAAADYCTQLTTAGGGWRLPTRDEAKALVDEEEDGFRCSAPCAFQETCSDYWTSTRIDDDAYAATQTLGEDERMSVEDEHHVRCVK